MDTPSPVSWIFKPESAGTSLAQHTYLSPSSLNRSPHSFAHAQPPLTSQRHTSPMTPRASTMQQLGSPYRAAIVSPQSSVSTARAQSATQSQDLLLPMMPSTEDSKLHATVSGLRFALQETQLQLGHAQHQVDTLQQRCTATDAQAVQLQQQLTNLHADNALLGARLHDGSLDMVKGQLIQQLEQQLAESTQAAAAAGAASQHASAQVQSLQDQLALQQQAQASERERLSMEAAQSRLLCKARARQVNTLELQYKAQVERADSATEEMQSARDEAARSISDSMLQQDAAMKQAQEAREASQQAHQQLQKAQHAQLAAEQQRQQAEASLRDVRLHMDWQETRIADLESQDIAQTARRYDSELQSMKQQLQQDRQRLEAQLLQEKRAREGAENQLHHTMSLSQSGKGFSPHSGNLGSPRKGRENSSPNKPRGSAGLQESVVLRAQLQQSREAAEREAAHWKAALEEEQHTSEKLRQQLNQLEESDQLVATAAANSQQQVHHLRQQLESEKTRTAVLDANLQAAAHSVRSSKAFKRRQRSRYTVQDSARMDYGHVDDHSWQHALGLTDNDTGSSAEEDDWNNDMDLGLQPVMVTVGLQTDDVALTALLAGTAGKDSLMSAARREILRLKDVNSRLLQQRSPGVDSGPVVAEKEAEAAVAAAKEAAHHQHEQALQRCNADWTARLDALKASLQEAKAEAQRVKECQAQLSRQHQVELQQAKTASQDKAAALQADIADLQERLASAEADLAAAQARVQQLEQQLQAHQAEAAATEKRMTAQMEQLKMDADTDLAMVMLESSSNASEAASRLDSIRINAEASKLAAVAELQQQLDAEREHRQQLQQQLIGMSGAPQLHSPASMAAFEEPFQAVAGSKASMQAGADKDMTLAFVSVHAKDDIPQGPVARDQAAEDCTEVTALTHAEAASSSSRAVDVTVQTDADLLEQPSSSALAMPPSHLRAPDSSAASAHPARQIPQQSAKQDATQQKSKGSPEASLLTADVHEKEEEAEAAQQAMHRSQDAGCDARSDAESAFNTGTEAALQTSAGHSSDNSDRSSSSSGSVRHKNAGRAVRSSTHAVKDGKIGSNHGAGHRRASLTAAGRQQAVSVQAQDRAVPIEAGVQGQQQKAKGKADGRLSRGLQLPQTLSIASLAKHAGVDKAFMQDWIASVKVPSEEATALSRMADAAAAAAAFTAEGLRDDLHRPSQQAQRAELAKRAQQASEAVLRGDADQGLGQEPDRRSYSRWSGMDAGDDDMCRTSSAVATPESSYATARAVPVSVSHPSVSSGHSSRKGHLPPVYTTSPVIHHHRLHQSSALHSATSPFATALPFSAALPLSPGHRPASPQADTPRFATLGHANTRKSVYDSSSHHPHRSSGALEGSAVSYGRSSHALMPSSYRGEPSASASQHHATTREGKAVPHADHRASSHTHFVVRASMYPNASSGELSYPQAGSDASPMRRALARSPHNGAIASSSPYRSPAHAAAVSAVEQHLHTSLHAGSGLFGSSRAVANSPALTPQPSHGRQLSAGRYNGEVYQKWTGQSSSPADLQQHSDMHVNTRHAVHAVRLQHGPSAGPESLLRPAGQYLHPSPELDSLSQRLREQKVAMGRQGQIGVSPLEPEAGYSPGRGFSAYKHAASRTGVQQIHQEGGRNNPSPSRLAGVGTGPEAGRAWSPLPQGQGRSWSALGNDDASSDLQASMYHRERSRLQEALARQHAASAATSIAAAADPLPRSESPWDSAWDQQSAALRGHSHESHGRQSNLSSARHQEHSRGVFGSIVNDYRLPAVQTSVGSRSDRYAHG
ncbi:TPA: hypothetical protein ACH3X1_004593 [Trebouxia sp. C0004]